MLMLVYERSLFMAIEIDIWDDNTWTPIEKTRTRFVSRVSSDYEGILSTGFSWSHSKPIIGLCHWQFLCQNPLLKAPIVRKRRLGLLTLKIPWEKHHLIWKLFEQLCFCQGLEWNKTVKKVANWRAKWVACLTDVGLNSDKPWGGWSISNMCAFCFPEGFWVSTGCFHVMYIYICKQIHISIIYIYAHLYMICLYIWYMPLYKFTARRTRYVIVYLIRIYTCISMHFYACLWGFQGSSWGVERCDPLWCISKGGCCLYQTNVKWLAFKIGSCLGMDGSI